MSRVVSRRPVRHCPAALTQRETAVFMAYLDLGSYKAAADALDITEGYVGDVLANVRAKTGSATNAQAALRLAPTLNRARSERQRYRENTG